MKNVYKAFVNIFIFYFLVSLFNGVLGILMPGANTFVVILIPAIIYGILVAALPTILGFFKIKENTGALLLGGVVVNFLFYFLGHYVFRIFAINGGNIVLGIPALAIRVDDQTLGLLIISLLSSLVSVGIEAMSKKK